MPLGLPELLVILAILLLVFGPKRLPRLGRQLGNGLRELRASIAAKSDDEGDDEDDDAKPAELSAGPPRA
jgi:sec-independent protein translocase protein TatA